MIELEQYSQDLTGIRKSILAAGEALHVDQMREQIDELTEEMNQPEFWTDTERSTRVNQKLGHLKNRLAHYEGLLSAADDVETMMELAKEENDEGMVAEAGEELKKLKEQADALELETLMRGNYDDNDAVLSLHAGAGGTEAQDWTQMLYRMYTRFAERMGFTVKELDLLEGDDAGIKSMSAALKSAFESIGITRIKTIGEPLDPAKHNAIQVAPAPENIAPNTITDEFQAGYMMGDNVLRTAMVVVAK